MAQIFYVFVGGGLGSVARYLVALGMTSAVATGFPYATLTVNTIGSFLIGLIMHVALTTTSISLDVRLFLTTGIIGGFTTYSTFNYETLSRFQEGAWLVASLNLALTVVASLVAGVLGLAVGRAIVGVLAPASI